MINKDRLPKEMRRKLDKILAMDYPELMENYVRVLNEGGVPLQEIAAHGPPSSIEVIYRVLIPELFDYAHAAHVAKMH